jgi:mono/diheme cytochrome c family protein
MAVTPAEPCSGTGLHRAGPAAAARVLALLLLAPGGSADAQEMPGWMDIARIFDARCVNCHARDAAAAALRLDSYEDAIAGGVNGAVLVAGDAPASELIRRLRGTSRPRMPFLSSAMPIEEILLIERWIDAGMPRSAGAGPGSGEE